MKHLILLFTTIALIHVSCKDEAEEILEEIIEDDTSGTIEGNYTGGWWSDPPNENNYVNIPASARIRPGDSDSTWVGEFFFTSSFTSCCNSGANDGTISFTLSNDIISNFVYNDIIPQCNGLFEGDGRVSSSGKLIIEFTGSDCEGEHEGGMLELSKN